MMIRPSLIILVCAFVVFESSSCQHVTPNDRFPIAYKSEDQEQKKFLRIKRKVVLPAQLPPEMEGVENTKTETLKKFFDSQLVSGASPFSSDDSAFHISEIRVICSDPLKIECYYNGGMNWNDYEWNESHEDWDLLGGGYTFTDVIICRYPSELVEQEDRPLDNDTTEKDDSL